MMSKQDGGRFVSTCYSNNLKLWDYFYRFLFNIFRQQFTEHLNSGAKIMHDGQHGKGQGEDYWKKLVIFLIS